MVHTTANTKKPTREHNAAAAGPCHSLLIKSQRLFCGDVLFIFWINTIRPGTQAIAGVLTSIHLIIQTLLSKKMFTVKLFIFEMFLMCFVACNEFPSHQKRRSNSNLSAFETTIQTLINCLISQPVKDSSTHYLNQSSLQGFQKCSPSCHWAGNRVHPGQVRHFITGLAY